MKTLFLCLKVTIAAALFLQSCSTDQHIHFNKDFSGEAHYLLDLSGMAGMGSDSIVQSTFDSSKTKMNELKEIEGISNVNFSRGENSTIKLDYNFKNVKALNASVVTLMEGDHKTYFTQTKNEITYTSNPNQEEAEDKSAADMFTYKLRLTFDRKVVSCSNPGFVLSDDKKELVFQGSIFDLMSKSFNYTVKLK